ncbi:hypothetical protein CXB51_027946 [Gossypium anomalum]|uniref:Endonuclease/exonuclease/phosphatase domain-containing protein n=1 Tax=Gossypium anomalum TaxID=47600 RepID=A0A8J5XXA9_9ROSI|nr:hypothetical protein CXB51_027946 [Gossypium anomalum]
MASSFSGVLSTKKVRFKDSTSVLEDEMVLNTITTRTLSWKDLVLGNKLDGQKVMDESNPLDKDFSLQDEDDKKSIVNDIPFIDFSKRIHQLFVEEMATSVVSRSSEFSIQKGNIMRNWGFDRKSDKTIFQYRQQGGITVGYHHTGCCGTVDRKWRIQPVDIGGVEIQAPISRNAIRPLDLLRAILLGWRRGGEQLASLFKQFGKHYFKGPLNYSKKAANVGVVAGIFSSIPVEGNNDFSLCFNLTFEELNVEAVAVRGGILDAKKHSAVVFQEKENLKLSKTSDNSELYIVGGSSRSTKGKGVGEKSFGSKGATDLISSELNGQAAKIMMNEEGERLDISTTKFVDLAQLQDLGFKGPLFTWHCSNLFERLDRALRNEVWLEFYPSSLVSHLPTIKSDHRPLIFNFNSDTNTFFDRPFRFLASWREHPNFSDFVVDNWNFDGNITNTIARFTERLKDWNKCV